MNRFLNHFTNDKPLGKDSLKFAKEFVVAVTHGDTTTVGSKEDCYPIGVILKEFGRGLNDFPNVEEALAAVRHLCAVNQAEFGYEPKAEAIDEKFPEYSKFWYRLSLGKEEKNTSSCVKNLHQQSDVKTLSQLHQAKIFMEGMGFNEENDKGDDTSVTIESVLYTELKQKVELMKLP